MFKFKLLQYISIFFFYSCSI